MKKLSLKLRLIISFFLAASVIWVSAGIISWHESREQTDEFFDTYQLLLARQLAGAGWESASSKTQDKVNRIIDDLDDDGEEEDEALGLAVFDQNGKMVFNDGENGKYFPYMPGISGFVNQPIGHKGKIWRLVWVPSADKKFNIAVGQELKYRKEAALELVEETLLPWLAGLAVLLLATVWLVSRELKPLKDIAKDLSSRSANDLTPLKNDNILQEIQPLVKALNQLFVRIEEMFKRERSFISDSAHELRSPLTALKVQLEVAQLAGDDKKVRDTALNNLNLGIERSARLVEQLLALSRLEASVNNSTLDGERLDWQELIAQAVAEQEKAAREKYISIHIQDAGSYPAEKGEPLLWMLLLRNLLDNAVRYSPPGAEIKLNTSQKQLSVYNSGIKANPADIKRLGERFFRPPGQSVSGSGLGLSIVGKIAAIHGCKAEYANCEDGFMATISIEKQPKMS